MVDLTNAQMKQEFDNVVATIQALGVGGGDDPVRGLPLAVGTTITVAGTASVGEVNGRQFITIDNPEGVVVSSSQIVRRGNGLDIDYTQATNRNQALAYFLMEYKGKRIACRQLLTRPTANGVQNVAIWEVVG